MYTRDTVSTLLSIAPADNLGATGTPADIKTASSFGVAASAVTTAIISQTNTHIKEIHMIPAECVAMQLDAVFDTFTPDAVKVGLLPSPETVRVVADRLRHYKVRNIVVDPALIPINGKVLAGKNIELFKEIKRSLFPIATIVTPDFEEALAIAGLERLDSPKDFGKILFEKSGAKAVLLKGGDSKSDYCTDILFTGDDTRMFRQSRIPSGDTLGSGSVLSSAIACGLAKGFILPKAVRMAKDFISFAIQKGLDMNLSFGDGPLYIFNK